MFHTLKLKRSVELRKLTVEDNQLLEKMREMKLDVGIAFEDNWVRSLGFESRKIEMK